MLTESIIADLLIFSILGLISLHTLKLRAKKQWFAFDPLNAFWAGVLICYIYQPISFSKILIEWRGVEIFNETLFWVLFTLIFVIVGYESRISRRLSLQLPHFPAKLDPFRLSLFGYLFVGLGVVGYAYLFSSAGGMDQWLEVGRGGTDWVNVSGYIAQLENMLPAGLTLLLFHARFHNTTRFKKLVIWGSSLLLWLWFVYLGTRSRTVFFGSIMLAANYLPRRKNPPPSALIVIFIFLLVLSNFQANYRENFTNLSFNLDRVDWSDAKSKSLPSWMLSPEERNYYTPSSGLEFNCAMAVIELVPSRIDYNYGYSYMEFFTRIIPRKIWPDKTYPHYEAFTPIYREGGLSASVVPTSKKIILAGPSFTFVGHWYAIGGPLALVVAGFFAGFILRAIRSIYDREPGNEGDLLAFVNLMMLGFFDAVGTPLFWVFTVPFTVIPLLLVLRFARLRPPKPVRQKRYFLNNSE